MKKILVLMAMFVLALGAQAEYYRYTFAIDIKGLPSDYSFSGNTGLYLIDTRNDGLVLAYTRSQSDNYKDKGTSGWQTEAAVVHNDSSVVVHGDSYALKGHEVGSGATLLVDKNGVFQFTGNIFGLIDGEKNPLDGLSQGDLKLVVDSTSGAYFESKDFSFSHSQGGTYTINGTIFVNVPEPTSGLLLLMGVAGLALRRKRAV